jgi:hypothetical protein
MDAFYWTSSSSSGPYGEAAYGGAGWGYDSLKNFRQITPAVQTHLKLVHPAAASSSPPPCVLGSSFLLSCVRFSLVAGVSLRRRSGFVLGD